MVESAADIYTVSLIRIGLVTGVIVAPLAWLLTRAYADLDLSWFKITLGSIAAGPLVLGCGQLPKLIFELLMPRKIEIDRKGIIVRQAGLRTIFRFSELAGVSITRMENERHVLQFNYRPGCWNFGISEGVNISALQRLLQAGLHEEVPVSDAP